jgi:hypothetical protein
MMNQYLEKIKSLYRSERYDDALPTIETAEEQTIVSPALLVWK